MRDLAYLKLLAREYPSLKAASSEIINLMAINGLPKGTEYFFSDLHGEYEAFSYLLRSASGIIREKIRQTFGYIIPEEEQVELANLIYYPVRTMSRLTADGRNTEDWQRITVYRLVQICKEVVLQVHPLQGAQRRCRRSLPTSSTSCSMWIITRKTSGYITTRSSTPSSTLGMADKFIIALCELIQNLAVDRLHIIGDIFDRGPRADIIMDELMRFHDVDIQWGNHDISWMGAATGNPACVCNVLRIAISYNSFDVLEDGYGINLRPLSMFAAKVYRDDPCERFRPAHPGREHLRRRWTRRWRPRCTRPLRSSSLRWRGRSIQRHPEYGMEDRLLLDKMDFENGHRLHRRQGVSHAGHAFSPPWTPKRPLELTRGGEGAHAHPEDVRLNTARLLHRHVRFLYSHGGHVQLVQLQPALSRLHPHERRTGALIQVNVDGNAAMRQEPDGLS